jgi:hypothetical protein
MTSEEKAARLEGMAAKKDFAAEHAKSAVFGGGTWVAEFTADAALLREAAQLMRERCDPEWSVLLEREYKDRMLSIAQARPGVAYWYVDAFPDYEAKVADSLDAAKAAAIAWVDGQEGK